MPKCGLFVGSLALSLAEVSAARQKADVSSAVHVVEEIGELLQEKNLGTGELANQLSEYASAAVTPGAEGSFAKSLNVLVSDLEAKIEKNIRDGQAATQGKLDKAFQGLEASNTAATAAKQSAVATDKQWFHCVAHEQAARQDAEHAGKVLSGAKSDENTVCQNHQDSTGFKYDGTGKFTMNFACDHAVSGSCEAALKSWEDMSLQKMLADAQAHMAKEQESHDTLKASCEAKTQARVEAQQTLDSAESTWGTRRAACKKLQSQRQTVLCDFGTAAQSKCSAEAEYAKLNAATQLAKGDADSEVDRESEWLASGATKCMIKTAIGKGLNGALAGADLDECAAKVNFGQEVGKLNRRQAEFDALSKSNACAAGPITFFNGKSWDAPAGDKPSSSSYTEKEFTPQLDPTAGNFAFCSNSPAVSNAPMLPPPDVESRPQSKRKCDNYLGDLGKVLGGESHSIVMALHFAGATPNSNTRQWILNIGQTGTGSEHWLWTPSNGAIQFGIWNGRQIHGVDIPHATTLATVYDAPSQTYSLYVNGKYAKTQTGVKFNINKSTIAAGDKQGYSSNANFDGCVSGIDIYYSALTAEQVQAAAAKLGNS